MILELIVLIVIVYFILKGETNIELTIDDKKKYKFHSKDFKCKVEKEDLRGKKRND